MKAFKVLLITLLLVFATSTASVFAENEEFSQPEQEIKLGQLDFGKVDPIKELNSLKNQAKEDYRQGKISKDELNDILAKLDRKQKAVKEFNKLSLEQKKKRLINDFSKALDRNVQEGKISVTDVDSIMASYTQAINEWNGDGFPTFYHKSVVVSKAHTKAQHEMHKKCMQHMHMKFVEALDKAVKAGTIDVNQKQEILKYLHDSMEEMK